MAGDYSDCIKRRIDSIGSDKKLRTHFLHPKLVVICEDKVTVLNSETNSEGNSQNDTVYQMEDRVVDTILQDHLLWIVIASGQVSVINVLEGGHVKIELLNFSSYKIRELKMVRCNLYFISESEEQLVSSYSVKEIVQKMAGEMSELQIAVEKIRSRQNTFFRKNPTAYIHGMNIFIEEGSIITECLMTSFRQTIVTPTGLDLEHILTWNELLVLANDCNMWIINIVTDTVVLEFKTDGVKYYPLGAYHDKFYYLFMNGEEVKLHCITKISAHLNQAVETNGCSKSSIKKSHSQEMLKSQVRSLIDSLISSGSNHEASLLQLKPLFEQIEDFSFLCDVGSKLCQINITYKSLIYLLQKKLAGSADESIIKDVCDIIYKMDITEYIHFKEITSYNTVNFFDHDFKQLCVMFLTNSDFDLASLCWLKCSELKVSVSTDEILSILSAIPNNAKIGTLIIWLKNFVPSLLDENPFYIDLFVRWTTERIFMLENSAYWPKIGLKFTEEITNVLESSMKTIAVRPISMDDLDVLKDRITYIMELKEKYKINMLVGELSSLNQTEVALIMLRRCYTEDLKLFLQEYLATYATRHGFELDDVLQAYIEGEAASGGGSIDGLRLSILLNTFRMPSTKLDCLLGVLRVLDVPWDASIYDLALTSAALATNDFTSSDSDRKLAREIGEELNYANLKVVLKKHNYSLTNTDYLLVIHKIINAPTVDVKDLKTVMSVTTSYKNYGSFLYIDRCLRDCNTKEALDYFGGLSDKEIRLVFKSVMSKYDHMIKSNMKNQVIERSYIDFIKGVHLLDESEMTTVENMYHLKNSYQTNLSMNNMYRENSHTRQEFTGAKNSIPNKGVARLLRKRHSQNSALLNLLQRTSTNTDVRTFFETLLISFSYLDYMSCDKISSMICSFTDAKDNASFLVESSQMLLQLICNCAEEYLYYLTTILSVLNAVINTGIVMRNLSTTWKFHYMYIPMSSFGIEEELLKFYAQLTDDINDNNEQLMMLCSKNEFVPFRLLPHLNKKSEVAFLQFKEKAVAKLLSRISASNETDELFITSLLLALCKDDAADQRYWLEDLLKGNNEITPVNMATYLASPVVRKIFHLGGISPRAVSYPPQQILKSKYNMTLADIALPDITEETWDAKLVLFYVLKQLSYIELERLHDLCRTLNVSVDDGLSLQLIARLTAWDLKYSFSIDELGRKKVCVESHEQVLLRECIVIWESIKNKDFIKDILNDLWKNGEVSLHGRLISVNPYFYEVFLCIYQLIFGTSTEIKTNKEYFLLNFLKDYKRKSNPQQYEFELFSVKGMFPEIGHYRLPFHLFMRDDMWANLKSEITLETYELWLPAVALLSLDNDIQTAKDMICSNALKQTMKTRKPKSFDGESKESEPWRLSTREEPLLRAAHRCVRHIANMEWAGACLFYVLQGCGRGADQVAAAQLCFQFAKRWESLQPGNRAVRKMERLHSTLSTRHALHKIEWATDEFVQLLAEPTQLIRAMYLHPNFVDKMSRYNVNGATNEIAEKNGINISSIRIQILENILEKNNETSNKMTNNVALENKTLMTAKYILKATCPKMGAIYLSRIAFDDETDFNKHKKLRALQCLMSVVEPDTALKVTNQERDVLWNSLLEIYYTVSLENIEMPWAVGAFMQDKRHALEQILAAIGTNTNGLKLIAKLACRYGDRHIYIRVMKVLLKAGLNEEMIPLLLKILSPPDELVRTAWRAVLLSPFQSADYPITDRQKFNCLRAINLLPLCPVVRDEDLKEIWKNCIRCKCFGIGCLVLPYMTNEARQGLTELRRIDRRNLIASLKNLHSETYLVSGAMHVVENMIPKGSYR